MRKIIYVCLIIIAVILSIPIHPALALNTLQLDIEGGTYDPLSQTIIAPGDPFTLYAFLIPDSKNPLTDIYYISAALVPKITPPGGTLGSFTFNGDTIDVTGEMTYGVPPLEGYIATFDAQDLQQHGIFETYFKEFGFNFDSTQYINGYNTQDRAINGYATYTSDIMYYKKFTVDSSLLNPDYVLHFDLYNPAYINKRDPNDLDICQSCFAPFSHDAEGRRRVPEPAVILLLGIGIIGLGLFGLWERRRG